MYQPHQKDDHNRLNKYIPLSSPKYKSTAHPIVASLQRLSNFHEVRFEEIQKACIFLETCLNNTEQTIARLEERIHEIQQMRSTETISNLRQKQNEFIIHQLKEKIKKHEKNQQNMEIELKHLKKQLQSLKRQQKMTHNQTSLNASRVKQQISQLEKVITEKDRNIEQLTKNINKLIEQKKQDKKAQLSTEEKLKKNKDDQFRLLETKLLELERDFDSKVASLQQEVKEKSLMMRKLEEELDKKRKQMDFKQKQFQIQLKSFQDSKSLPIALTQSQQLPSNMTVTFNPTKKSFQSTASDTLNSQNSTSTYELELKLSHQQNLYKQLEHEHTTHLTQCNNLQIQLHQQIHQQKLQLQEEKKKYKTEKKKTIQLLQSLPTFVNKRTFNYFDSNADVQTVVQEIKKLIGKEKQKWEKQLNQSKNIEKQHQDKIAEIQKQNRKLKSQNNLIKQQMDNISQQLQRLVAQREKDKQKEKEKQKQKQQKLSRKQSESEMRENSFAVRQNSSFVTESNKSNSNSQVKAKQSLNGSLGEISNAKSETVSILQEKYKTIVQALKAQIQQKDQHIAELQNLQSIDFEKSKEKILAIESQLADSRNEVRKLERQCKQLRQKSAQLSKESKSLKLTVQELKQKQLKQKQTLMNNHQQKVKSLQQKITKLKDQNQQIDSKCQQKVMKYNKLKAKVEKLEMYNSETEKRKDTQIQDLIKKNQHLKMDCKLLEQKLNIAQTLQLNTTTTDGQDQTPKSTYAYNKDLIEQIQMQRDRILEQYEGKRRQHIKLKELYDLINEENNQLKQEITKYEQYKQKAEKQKEGSIEEKQKQFQQTQKTIAKLIEQKQLLASELAQLKKQLSAQKISKEIAQKQLAKITQEQSNKSKQQYQHLKKQLQSQFQTKKKLEKEQQALVQRIKELKEQNQKLKKQTGQLKKQMQQKAKSLETRWQQKYKEKTTLHQQQLSKLKQQHQRKTTDLEQKITQAQIREQNLVNIINYKNMSVSGNVRESMKGDEEQHRVEEVKKYDFHEMLPIAEVKEINFGEMADIQTNTIDVRDTLSIYQMESIVVEPYSEERKFTIQTLPVICVQDQRVYMEQYSQVNIFDQESQLLTYLRNQYPSIWSSIIQSAKLSGIQEMKHIQKQNIQQMTAQTKQFTQIGVNTQSHSFTQQIKTSQRQSIKNRESIGNNNNNRQSIKSGVKQSSFILDKEWLGSDEPSHSSVQRMPIPESNGAIPPKVSSREKFDFESNKVGQINLFQNLKPNINLQIGIDEQNIDDNFQICEQGESINVGRTALNLQIKEIFNKLREQLEKVFNGEQISLSMIKILPRQLEDDYNEFIAYVREKISEIKTQNQLSFIMAQVGDSPQEIQEQLDNELRTFIDKKTSQDIFTYKKLVQQKQALITSLMNERTMQQNTINQMTMEKEQMDQEHENRFMNQCNIYKKEIKELKNKVDNLEMNFQSLKNIFKNTMEIWVDEMENQDDLRDNFTIYKKIAKLTQTQSTRLNYYIFRYREIKGIDD